MRPLRGLAVVAIVLSAAIPARSAPPRVYTDPLHESPVRAVPGELMLIAGSGLSAGDTVVYSMIADTTERLAPPTAVPASSTPATGIAAIVASNDAPDAIAVVLPAVLVADASYAFWVTNDHGTTWSEGFKANDARPMWLSPDIAYRTAGVGTIGRQVKLVGRNLQPAPGASTKVRFVGPTTRTLVAENDNDPATAIEHYVAKVTLPVDMPAGFYGVHVSRDGRSWVPLAGQKLEVRADPIAPKAFAVGRYGCLPNDGRDDTACIVAAIRDATPTGGRVTFGEGAWNVGSGDLPHPPPDVHHGVVVPERVGLAGAGRTKTTLVRGAAWKGPSGQRPPVFTLQGRNVVSDATFADTETYGTSITSLPPFFRLGKLPRYARASDPTRIDDVTFMRNTFARPFVAIGDGGFPIRRLIVTGNEFGAYYVGLFLDGNRYLPDIKFRIDDSVISGNTFLPGGYHAPDPKDYQGAMASELGAGHRVDFSGNVADGRAKTYLTDSDQPGWRAAFFWHLRNNHEHVLVSQNTGTCTGDKGGDGEMIDFDANGNTYALARASQPSGATATSITLPGPLATISPADSYAQHWVQIVNGAGLGQARKIVSYTDPSLARVTFTVAPGWDVVPRVDPSETPGSISRATVARQYWQVYTVDNVVDIRSCRKTNPHRPKSGEIDVWGLMVDGTFENNRQYESDGLMLNAAYDEPDPGTKGPATEVRAKYFVEIRGNTVDHEYAYDDPCSLSGIKLEYGSRAANEGAIVEAYGVNVVKNTVVKADGLRGGGIAIVSGWFSPTAPMFRSTLIQGNTVRDIQGEPIGVAAPDKKACDVRHDRIGINLAAGAWRTVLFKNAIGNVANPIVDGGTQTVNAP